MHATPRLCIGLANDTDRQAGGTGVRGAAINTTCFVRCAFAVENIENSTLVCVDIYRSPFMITAHGNVAPMLHQRMIACYEQQSEQCDEEHGPVAPTIRLALHDGDSLESGAGPAPNPVANDAPDRRMG